MSDYTGPTITHQAIEHIPNGYRPGETLTRCWSKWTDGSITHNDTINTYHQTPHGTLIGTMFVNIGRDRDMRPPPGLKWVSTAEIRAALDSAKVSP